LTGLIESSLVEDIQDTENRLFNELANQPPDSAWIERVEVEAFGWSATIRWEVQLEPEKLPWWRRLFGARKAPRSVTQEREMVLLSGWDRALEDNPASWKWEDDNTSPPPQLAHEVCNILRYLRESHRGYWKVGDYLPPARGSRPYR